MSDHSLTTLQSSGSIASARWADPDDIFNRFAYNAGDIWLGRNPHNGDQAIGYNDDKHIMVCAGSRSGKGRSFVINNLALWQGSTVTYDPKGELPVILAARRGEGDEHCDGMGQDVFVLDPLNHSGVDPKYLAYFDPLAGLDPNDGELASWAKRIATALIKVPVGTESEQWAKRAARYIALLIMHVLTSEHIAHDERTLMTVLRYVLEGRADLAAAIETRMRQANEKAIADGKQPPHNIKDIPDPLELLADEMIQNKACRGHIAQEAQSIKRMVKGSSTFFESIRGEAADQLDWFKSHGIEQCLTGIKDYDADGEPIALPKDRRLDPARLKTDPKGISVFIVMPIEDIGTYEPWIQTVFVGLFAAMRKTKGKPQTGRQVLTVIDEFSSLGYQDYIVKSLDNIAGSGMKLMFIVQNYGTMKELYKDRMESFFTNSGLEIYFGQVGATATEYLQKELGQTEVVRVARSTNQGETTSTATGKTSTEGGSDSETFGESDGETWGWNSGINYADSRSWGQSDGKSMGRNYGPHVFMMPLASSLNFGSSSSKNTGGSHTKSLSKSQSGGKTKSTNRSKSTGTTWSNAFSETKTEGYQIGSGIAETFHKKPLLEPNEINTYLKPFAETDRDHTAYPGLMLVRMEGEHPTFLRRSNYDQDPVLERCFTPDPSFDFVPIYKQPLLGFGYTDAHIWAVKLPSELIGIDRLKISIMRRATQWFEGDEDVLEVVHLNGETRHHNLSESGRIVSISTEAETKENGAILIARMARALQPDDAANHLETIFATDLKTVRDEALANRKEADAQEAERQRLQQKQQRAKQKLRKKILIGVSALVAVVVVAVTVDYQIEQFRIRAQIQAEKIAQQAREVAEKLRIDTEIQTADFFDAVKLRQDKIDQEKLNRQNAINVALKYREDRIFNANRKRLDAISGAIKDRKAEIDRAKLNRRREQDRIDRDKKLLGKAISARELRIEKAREDRLKKIEIAKKKRRYSYEQYKKKQNQKIVKLQEPIRENHRQEIADLYIKNSILGGKIGNVQTRFNSLMQEYKTWRAMQKLIKAMRPVNIEKSLRKEEKKRYNYVKGYFSANIRDTASYHHARLKACDSKGNYRNIISQPHNPTDQYICNVFNEFEATVFQTKNKYMDIKSDEWLKLQEASHAWWAWKNIKNPSGSFNEWYLNAIHNLKMKYGKLLNEKRSSVPIIRFSDYQKLNMSQFPEIEETDFSPVDKSKYPLAKLDEAPPIDMTQFPEIDMNQFPHIDMAQFPEIDLSDYPEVDTNQFAAVDMAQFPLVKLTSGMQAPLLATGAIKY